MPCNAIHYHNSSQCYRTRQTLYSSLLQGPILPIDTRGSIEDAPFRDSLAVFLKVQELLSILDSPARYSSQDIINRMISGIYSDACAVVCQFVTCASIIIMHVRTIHDKFESLI